MIYLNIVHYGEMDPLWRNAMVIEFWKKGLNHKPATFFAHLGVSIIILQKNNIIHKNKNCEEMKGIFLPEIPSFRMSKFDGKRK